MSAAPPTYDFKDIDQNVSNQENWSNEMGVSVPIPNSPGARAYLGPTGKATTELTINQPTTLGTMDINRPGLTVDGSLPVTFDTEANNAVIFVRNTNNFTGQVDGNAFTSTPTFFAAPLVLDKTLEIVVDTDKPLIFESPASGTGGIIKDGLGEAQLDAANGFSGGITIDNGTLTALANGALGNNTVNLNGGMLNILAAQPFAGSGSIAVGANSQVNIGTNGVTGVTFNVATFGAVSGSAGQLSSLQIGSNLLLKPNSMISHQTFDITPGSSNPQGLTGSPQYIFGISNDFTSAGQSILVGSTSGTPWTGFGSDIASHVFGGGVNQALNVSGTAQLVALGGELKINAPIQGSAGSSLIKNGAGLVSINSPTNSYSGPTEVQSGPMAINTAWNGPVTVDAGASFGGTGNINALVTFLDSATTPTTFQPGVMGPVANSASSSGNQTINGPGTITTGTIAFGPHTHLVFDLDQPGVPGGANNDLLLVNGDVTLDGILDVNAGPDFTEGLYPLIKYTGTATDNGLVIGNFDFEQFPGPDHHRREQHRAGWNDFPRDPRAGDDRIARTGRTDAAGAARLTVRLISMTRRDANAILIAWLHPWIPAPYSGWFVPPVVICLRMSRRSFSPGALPNRISNASRNCRQGRATDPFPMTKPTNSIGICFSEIFSPFSNLKREARFIRLLRRLELHDEGIGRTCPPSCWICVRVLPPPPVRTPMAVRDRPHSCRATWRPGRTRKPRALLPEMQSS